MAACDWKPGAWQRPKYPKSIAAKRERCAKWDAYCARHGFDARAETLPSGKPCVAAQMIAVWRAECAAAPAPKARKPAAKRAPDGELVAARARIAELESMLAEHGYCAPDMAAQTRPTVSVHTGAGSPAPDIGALRARLGAIRG